MLEQHTLTNQSAQLTRARNYIEDFELSVQHSRNAPEWTIDPHDVPVDTDYSMPNTPGALGDEKGDHEGNKAQDGDDEGDRNEGGNGEE